MMKRFVWIWIAGPIALLLNVVVLPWASAETAEELFNRAQTAYGNGQVQQALDLFEQVTRLDENHLDAYFNMGAIYFNTKRYTQALESFNKLLQRDPDEQAARYEIGRVYEKLGRIDESIAAFELIGSASSRYSKAQENIARLKEVKQNLLATKTSPDGTPSSSVSAASQSTSGNAAPDKAPADKASAAASEKPATPNDKAIVQEFAAGFNGPTGVAVDGQGMLYVANFSKNTIYKVNPSGEKKILASGFGINGPVGLTLDHRTGDLYIANHLDNTISRISKEGKVSVVATGLKKPYNIFLDEASRTLYVSQPETNSIARIKLN